MSRYTAPPITLQKIVAYLQSLGSTGASRAEIVKALGMSQGNVNRCLLRWLPRCGIFRAGWDRHYLYFADKAHADAHQARLPELKREFQRHQQERRKLEQRAYLRRVSAKKAALKPPNPPKPEKPVKVSIERAKNAYVVVKGRDAPVKIASTEQVMRTATVVMSAGIKVTRCGGWTHDIRYQLPPGQKVVGGFATMGPGRYLDGQA
jgi:hypothetical protein